MSNPRQSAFHPSVVTALASIESPLYAMRLIRMIAFHSDLSHEKVEIVLGLATYKKPVLNTVIYTFVPHLKTSKINRLLRELVEVKAVVKTVTDNVIVYQVDANFLKQIKALDKESLQTGIN